MYQNGKIYKLVSDSTDKIYIGSTCNPLYKRLCGHKTASRQPNKKNTSKELVKFDDCKIILIEDFPCERKEQLTARERYYIEQNIHICVNKIIPTRTKKEWEEQNKDKIAEQMKEYRQLNKDKLKEYFEQNKDKIAQQKKEYNEKNKDKRKEYLEQNKDKIAQQKKEYKEQNKDKIAQQRKEYNEQNKDKIIQKKKEWYQQNKDKIAERTRLRLLEKKKIKIDIKEDGTAI